MNKIMDKLNKRVTINRKLFIFLFLLFIIGLLVGSLFTTILKDSDQTLVKDSLNNFLTSINKNQLKVETTFLPALFSQIVYVLSVWLLGVSILGLPIVIILYFSKAFTLGFSIGSLLYHYHTKGILLSIAYIFPHQIINFFIYTILTIYSLSLSLKLLDSLIHKKRLDFRFILNKYLFILILSLVGVIITSLLEIFVMPKLISYILKNF